MDSTQNNPSALERLSSEAKRIEEDATYSAKSHFEAAKGWGARHYWIGIPSTLLSALAGISALKQQEVFAAVLSGVVAVLSALFTFLNPKDKATQHLSAGNDYKALQNDARIFREVHCGQAQSVADLTARLEELNKRRNDLNVKSPQIPRQAFENARKGIEAGEASYSADAAERKPKRRRP